MKLKFISLFSIFLASLTTVAQAAFITSNGDIAVASGGDAVPPIEHIKFFSSGGGSSFTNQIDGTAFTPFATIQTVAAYVVADATNGFNQPIFFPDTPNDSLAIVSVLRGTIVSGPGLTTASFSAGHVFALRVNVGGTFNPHDPETWDDGHTIVAEYVLAPPDDVVGGPFGTNINFAASQVNLSSVNSAAPQETQGRFLFNETAVGSTFINNVAGVPGLVTLGEQILAVIEQTVDFSGQTLTAGDLTAINSYYAALGTPWASGLGAGPATNYDPFPAGGPTGDFRAVFSGDNYLGISAVIPEPTSMLIWAGMGLAGAVSAVRRRKIAA